MPATPQLSWQSDSLEKDWRKRLINFVASNPELLRNAKADVWDSGKQNSAESVGILYGGPKLEARKTLLWSVSVWDAKRAAINFN